MKDIFYNIELEFDDQKNTDSVIINIIILNISKGIKIKFLLKN